MTPTTITTTVKKDLELYRQMLEAKRAELFRRRHEADNIAVERVADEMDQLVLASQRELAIEGINRDAILLRQISEALARIADGDYGICGDCEEEIAPKRLNAVPWAALCIRCQEAADEHRSNLGSDDETEEKPDLTRFLQDAA